ncbi:hypothetical protein CLF_108229 [Clonorchis sinensis]|uniref:Uncharacterized protein n=1 Tax=Clonorchis sinensis TaxID=79923 RepID=G7YRE3_CLOSI|nr:hypothetical protein CLF_108229 [Clonorchis sinensis]
MAISIRKYFMKYRTSGDGMEIRLGWPSEFGFRTFKLGVSLTLINYDGQLPSNASESTDTDLASCSGSALFQVEHQADRMSNIGSVTFQSSGSASRLASYPSVLVMKSQKPRAPNITPTERTALNTREQVDNVVITKADKGKATIVMNKSDYLQKFASLAHDAVRSRVSKNGWEIVVVDRGCKWDRNCYVVFVFVTRDLVSDHYSSRNDPDFANPSSTITYYNIVYLGLMVFNWMTRTWELLQYGVTAHYCQLGWVINRCLSVRTSERRHSKTGAVANKLLHTLTQFVSRYEFCKRLVAIRVDTVSTLNQQPSYGRYQTPKGALAFDIRTFSFSANSYVNEIPLWVP